MERQSEWKIIKQKNRKSTPAYIKYEKNENHLQAALGSAPVSEAEYNEQGNVGTAKKLKPDNAEATEYSLGPVGLVWDHLNWSCAYDPCSITLLYYI